MTVTSAHYKWQWASGNGQWASKDNCVCGVPAIGIAIPVAIVVEMRIAVGYGNGLAMQVIYGETINLSGRLI
ncbi:MAG: hypothetical protein ACI93R_001610 [Flavobacteriales bacterium]